MLVNQTKFARLNKPSTAARSVPAPVLRTSGASAQAWSRVSLRREDRSCCRVAQGEAAAAAPPTGSGSGPVSRTLTHEELEKYQVGQLVSGVVQEVKRFGVFVELGGGVVGMLPVTQISQQYVRSISRVMREGDAVKAMVINVDTEKGRLALSTQHLEPTPGDMLRNPQLVYDKAEETLPRVQANLAAIVEEERARASAPKAPRKPRLQRRQPAEAFGSLQIGDVRDGAVQSVKPYGVFVELEGGVVGLLHNENNAAQDNAVQRQVGDSVKVRVIEKDEQTGRVGLSTKEL